MELHRTLETLGSFPNLTVLYVMSGRQVDEKARRFIRDHRLTPFIFLVDADDKVIDEYGVRKTKIDEPIESGVPHPTTYVLDRDGIVRLKDTRRNFHVWLSAGVLRDVIAQTETAGAR